MSTQAEFEYWLAEMRRVVEDAPPAFVEEVKLICAACGEPRQHEEFVLCDDCRRKHGKPEVKALA